MPNRYIREDAIESEALNSVGWQAEVFYRRLLNRVDDFGRFTANTHLLRASIFPLQLDKVRDSDIPRLLAECQKAGLLFVYSADSKSWLVINKWEKGRANSSKIPPPPANICEQMKTFVYGCKHPSANAPDSDSDSDTDADTDTDSEIGANAPRARSVAEKSALQLRAEKLMRRREATPMSPKEQKAWKAALPAVEATTEDEWRYLEAFYALPQSETFARKSLDTLLNNWTGEIERARAFRRKGSSRDLLTDARVGAALGYDQPDAF